MSFVHRATSDVAVVDSSTAANGGVGRRRSNDYSNNDCKRIMTALVALVCAEYKLEPSVIMSAKRQKASVGRVRHIIMYLGHVEWSLTQQQIADFFKMERGSIKHACARIEDLRDLPSVDEKLDLLAIQSGARAEADILIVKGIKWSEMSQETREAIVNMGNSAAHLLALSK